MDRPAKVAIVGGGCAGVTAAFELTRPELAGKFDVTIYQMGWRLGGKGASGRGPSGRIEEHGLHIWLGYYENAFRLLRECYAELAVDPGDFDVADWRTSFAPLNDIGLSAVSGDDSWHNWSACFPPQPGLPGDPITSADLLSLPHYVRRSIDLLSALIRSVDSRTRNDADDRTPVDEAAFDVRALSTQADPRRMVDTIQTLIGGAFKISATVLIEALAVLQQGLAILPPSLTNPLTDLAEWIAQHLRRWLESNLFAEPYYQHLWEMMDLVIAGLVGVIRSGVLTDPRGFDAIDDHEWRDWLRSHGASERAVQSAFVRGLYDLVFAYEGGERHRPRIGAGPALRAMLRMFFTYRGAVMWRMRAGMGDVIFAPYYEVLRRRGVTFEFFHRLTNVRLSGEADTGPGEPAYVSALEFDVQAETVSGAPFSPLVSVVGRPCWPSQPDFSQLDQGERLAAEGWDFESHWDRRRVGARTLKVSEDFDFVVLGVGLGAIPHVAADILERDARWRRMVREVKTVNTQAFQIWLDRDLEALGWREPNLIGAAFSGPVDTWCDMTHTVPEEGWVNRPASILYFCAVLPDGPGGPAEEDGDYPARRQAEVRDNAIAHLTRSVGYLWPKAFDAGGGFRWEMLMDASSPGHELSGGPGGPARIDTQYWRANVNPSDRYVLAVPGSQKYRISPLDMAFDNLTIAGDWTACGLNEGCVEAAVISGRLAAHALAGAPLLKDIVGYDHP